MVNLLPRFDTFWMGWKERSFAVDPADAGRIFHGGMIHPALLVDGRALGRWEIRRQGRRLVVAVQPFAPLVEGVPARLEAEAQAVGHFLGQAAGLQVGPVELL